MKTFLPKKLLIVGCGYVGSAVVKALPDDWTVFALTRTDDRSAELRELGVQPIVANWLDDRSLESLPQVDYVLVSVPHRADFDLTGTDLAELTHQVGLANLLRHLPLGWSKLIYLSTTGVFGECSHEMVDETTPVSPTRIGPRVAVQAENWLEENLAKDAYIVLRLAGIYGRGRIPLAAKLRAGEPLAVPQSGYLNLVHVVDIARAIKQMLSVSMRWNCYVFSDGHPVYRSEFYEYLAKICGVGKPVFTEPAETDPRVRRATSKQVNPSLLVSELRFQYQFVDYRSGLEDSLLEL